MPRYLSHCSGDPHSRTEAPGFPRAVMAMAKLAGDLIVR